MKVKISPEQKSAIAELKKQIKKERKYVPMGHGDGFNQDLKIKELQYKIDQIKKWGENLPE